MKKYKRETDFNKLMDQVSKWPIKPFHRIYGKLSDWKINDSSYFTSYTPK